jgi:hypothetical protein
MVRLDRTIGFPKLIVTGTFALMVRSSRTMMVERDDTPLYRYLRAYGARPRGSFDTPGGQMSGTMPAPTNPRARP